MAGKRAPTRVLQHPTEQAPHFSPAGLLFLRQLPRNNRREWFEQRRDLFQAEVKGPMLAIIARVTQAMESFAPAHVRPPEKSLLRIYRDIRFSADKRPYKSHIAAWWTHDGLPKTSGAGFYFHLSAKEVQVAAGVYMPPREQLQQIRMFLLDHHQEFRRMLRRPALARRMTPDSGQPLTRMPKGFPPDHPAGDLVRQQQWGISASLPPAAALADDFAELLIGYFRAAAPVVHLLNTPISSAAAAKKRKPLFGLEDVRL